MCMETLYVGQRAPAGPGGGFLSEDGGAVFPGGGFSAGRICTPGKILPCFVQMKRYL